MGTRILGEGAEKVYNAAQEWVEQALRRDGSLFTPGEKIWSSEWLGELHKRFLNNPDESNATFLDKLKGQLKGSPAQVYQLMGEVLYFYFLIVRTKNSTNEQKVIDTVLGWSPSPIEIPQELINSLTPGIANPGTFFHTGRPFQVGFLIEFAEQWKAKTTDDQHRLINNPWAFKKFAAGINFRSAMLKSYPNSARIQLHALLHLVFPDTFESIVSVDDKEKIVKAFEKFVTAPNEDVDLRLAQVRTGLEAQYASTDLFFFTPHVRVQWDDDYKPDLWETFIAWAKCFFERPEFDEEERDYKLEAGRKLATVKEAIKNGASGWEDALKESFTSSNLTGWRIHQPFLNLDSPQLEEALRRIWGVESPASLEERVRSFQELGPFGTPGVMASFLLMADNPTEYPIYRPTPIQNACKLTGYPQPDSTDDWERYSHALDFFDELVAQAYSRGLNIRDRLDAQSLVWYITSSTPEDLPEYIREPLESYRRGNNITPPPAEPDSPPPPTDPWSPSGITALATELLWQPNYLQEIIQDLQEKRQVILYGPPGTGKTYVAREIAKQCKLNGGDFEIVQFHPSYSYEDFVEGYRPKLINNQPGFELTQGPLRRIATKAKKNKDATFILIIDELNRGNVAKVFGELYFLLEYRDEEVRLQYSGEGEGFSLPDNLWFICTMNTADRSIALMDAALRRRFYFAPFFPNEPPIEGLLRRWLDRENQNTLAADLVDAANKKLDRDMGIGPSYFMRPGQTLDESRVRHIWDRAVIPYVEEQFFGDEDKLAEFRFDWLKGQQTGQMATDEAPAGNTPNTPPENDEAVNTC